MVQNICDANFIHIFNTEVWKKTETMLNSGVGKETRSKFPCTSSLESRRNSRKSFDVLDEKVLRKDPDFLENSYPDDQIYCVVKIFYSEISGDSSK